LRVEFRAGLYQGRKYIVSTPVYEGPLDLLLQLIERAELDITKVALAIVTDQYLAHLQTMEEQRADEVSAFLVIAAKLVQIKSEALLPRPPVREAGEDDPADALIQQLIIYKRFKYIAGYLAHLEARGMQTYLRLAPVPRLDSIPDLGDLTLADLLSAAQSTFLKVDERQSLGEVVQLPRITIREKIHYIAFNLRRQGRLSFLQLFTSRPTTLEVVVTFLAMLELIKRRLVRVHQETLFGEIEIENVGLADEDDLFELEFGE
jgi:segregation and condensation protein A